MNIELKPLANIKPYKNNPRINDVAVEAVARSIREFGFRQPIVIDADGIIIVGHTRWKAAQRLGLAKVPVHVAGDLTAEQRKAYRIADNKTADIATWDLAQLAVELTDLQNMDVDLELLGFSADELAKLLGGDVAEGLTDPDSVPEPPDEAITQTGDLMLLGEHRLLCGDSASAAMVDQLLDGQTIHLVNTDPPYNVNVEPTAGIPGGRSPRPTRQHGHNPVDRSKRNVPKARRLKGDHLSDDEYKHLLHLWFGNAARVLAPGRTFYIWGGYSNCANYPSVLEEYGLHFAQAIIWDKQHPVLTRKDFMGAHEWCFYGWREGAAHQFLGPNNATDLWHVKKVNPQSMVHLTEKPVELAVRAIQYSSRPGENVLDLFGGSGSTIIGCEQTGRKAYLMEIDALYCDVIVQRWEKFTERKAERCRVGETPATTAETTKSVP